MKHHTGSRLSAHCTPRSRVPVNYLLILIVGLGYQKCHCWWNAGGTCSWETRKKEGGLGFLISRGIRRNGPRIVFGYCIPTLPNTVRLLRKAVDSEEAENTHWSECKPNKCYSILLWRCLEEPTLGDGWSCLGWTAPRILSPPFSFSILTINTHGSHESHCISLYSCDNHKPDYLLIVFLQPLLSLSLTPRLNSRTGSNGR
jgi:hypothetical protein